MGLRDGRRRGPIRSILWIGASLKDLRAMPEEVREEMGSILARLQEGQWHSFVKPFSGIRGVWQVSVRHNTDTYRLMYFLNSSETIFVLHVFKKKSRRGIGTPVHEIEVIRARLKRAKEYSDAQSR